MVGRRETDPSHFVVFQGTSRIAAGDLAEATAAARRALASGPSAPVRVFDGRSGAIVDLDLRPPAVGAMETQHASPEPLAAPAKRGRPRLGVVAREVTLLPRHWEWLAAQPGGASASLRRLVETARKANREADRARRAREAAYRFMAEMAGDEPGFEEAARALFGGDQQRLANCMEGWPEHVREQVLAMLEGA